MFRKGERPTRRKKRKKTGKKWDYYLRKRFLVWEKSEGKAKNKCGY